MVVEFEELLLEALHLYIYRKKKNVPHLSLMWESEIVVTSSILLNCFLQLIACFGKLFLGLQVLQAPDGAQHKVSVGPETFPLLASSTGAVKHCPASTNGILQHTQGYL